MAAPLLLYSITATAFNFLLSSLSSLLKDWAYLQQSKVVLWYISCHPTAKVMVLSRIDLCLLSFYMTLEMLKFAQSLQSRRKYSGRASLLSSDMVRTVIPEFLGKEAGCFRPNGSIYPGTDGLLWGFNYCVLLSSSEVYNFWCYWKR